VHLLVDRVDLPFLDELVFFEVLLREVSLDPLVRGFGDDLLRHGRHALHGVRGVAHEVRELQLVQFRIQCHIVVPGKAFVRDRFLCDLLRVRRKRAAKLGRLVQKLALINIIRKQLLRVLPAQIFDVIRQMCALKHTIEILRISTVSAYHLPMLQSIKHQVKVLHRNRCVVHFRPDGLT
jgi:hypothetical protein